MAIMRQPSAYSPHPPSLRSGTLSRKRERGTRACRKHKRVWRHPPQLGFPFVLNYFDRTLTCITHNAAFA